MRLGIYARLAITLSILLCLAMLTMGLVLLKDAQQRFNAKQLEMASTQVRTLADASLDALVTGDYELLERWVSSVIPEKYYAYAYLARSNGQVLTHSNYEMVARFLEPLGELNGSKIRKGIHNQRLVMEVFYPARVGDSHLANAAVAYYLDEDTFFENDVAIKIILLILAFLFAILGTTLFLMRKITGPLSDLTSYVSSTSITNKKFHLDDKLLRRRDEVGVLSCAFDGMMRRLLSAFEELSHEEERLKQRVEERTHELEESNQELEAFSYSVSHDLRAPLRAVNGFSRIMLEDYNEKLDDTGQDYLHRINDSTVKMEALIDDMLQLSRITRTELKLEEVNLSLLAMGVVERFQYSEPGRKVKIEIEDDLVCQADQGLMAIVLENLIGNAWKYTSKKENAVIVFGHKEMNGSTVFYIKDNGAGFNMKYADKLFEAFKRLHGESEFQGTGVGLATVGRVIKKHKGKIWAQAEAGKGATFYFELPASA